MPVRQPSSLSHSGGILVFDSVLDSAAEHLLEFTQFPVEDGAEVSEHAIRKPLKLSLTVTATQTPIRESAGFSVRGVELQVLSVSYGKQTTRLQVAKKRGVQLNVANAIAAVGRALQSAVAGADSIEGLKVERATPRSFSVKALVADAPVDRVGEFYDELLRLWATKTQLKLSFKGREYPDLYLAQIRKTDSTGEFGRSKFQLELQEVQKVTTKQVKLPAVPRARKKQDLGAASTGEQYGPPPPPDTRTELRKRTDAGGLTGRP